MPGPHFNTRNLLQETLEYMGTHGLRTEDIRGVIGRFGHVGTWADFARLADREYLAAGHGIDRDVKLVADGWWLERSGDAGGEWWQVGRPPTLPAGAKPVELKDIFSYL